VSQTVESEQDELARRHRAALRVVAAVFTLTLALVALALVLVPRLSLNTGPLAANTLLFTIFFLAVGSIVFRRTRFSSMRLQDVAALRGASGLLEILQWTTVYVALVGGVIAVLGFVFTLMTGERTNVFYPAVIAVAVLSYCYPRRAAWQSVVNALAGTPGEAGRGAKGTTA
jgi:hypothetical protein